MRTISIFGLERAVPPVLVLLFASLVTSAPPAQAQFGIRQGAGSSPVQGGAGPDGATNVSPQLAKCDKPMGTLAVTEPTAEISAMLAAQGLPLPTQVLRLMVQQSNCFEVVERGTAFNNIQQERQLAEQGNLQGGSNIGKGQLVAADFTMTPQIAFSTQDAGGGALGIASQLGSMFRKYEGVATKAATGVKVKQAQTTLVVADVRSGLQVAAAEGRVEKVDWNIDTVLGSETRGGNAGAYANTPEGKLVSAALLANYNNIIATIKNNPSLVKPRASEASARNAAASLTAGDPLATGDVVTPKIAGIRVFAAPDGSGNPVTSLAREDELVFLGEEKGQFIRIQGATVEGWVDRRMMAKKK